MSTSQKSLSMHLRMTLLLLACMHNHHLSPHMYSIEPLANIEVKHWLNYDKPIHGVIHVLSILTEISLFFAEFFKHSAAWKCFQTKPSSSRRMKWGKGGTTKPASFKLLLSISIHLDKPWLGLKFWISLYRDCKGLGLPWGACLQCVHYDCVIINSVTCEASPTWFLTHRLPSLN